MCLTLADKASGLVGSGDFPNPLRIRNNSGENTRVLKQPKRRMNAGPTAINENPWIAFEAYAYISVFVG